MTIVATILEMWEAGEGFSKPEVRRIVVKYADSFGAPTPLRKLMADKVPSFCLDIYRKLADVSGENRESEKEWRAGKAMQAMRQAVDYIVQTHEDDGFIFMTREEVKEFKDKHKPEHYSVWMDEYEGCVFLDGAQTKFGYRLRKVLRYLVEHRGERVPHSQLVAACGFSRNDEKEDAKTSRRWVTALRGAGDGNLKELIETKEGGFSYKGTSTFCIISSLWEQG